MFVILATEVLQTTEIAVSKYDEVGQTEEAFAAREAWMHECELAFNLNPEDNGIQQITEETVAALNAKFASLVEQGFLPDTGIGFGESHAV